MDARLTSMLIFLSCKHPCVRDVYPQDGDFSTSWTCAAADLNGVECTLDFDLFYYRHIKQIKIGELLRHLKRTSS